MVIGGLLKSFIEIIFIYFVIQSTFYIFEIMSSKNILMGTKTFRIVTSIAMIFNLTAVIACLVCIFIVGFFPAIIGLSVMAFVPFLSRLYVKRKYPNISRSVYTILIIGNLLSMFLVLWASFVNAIDNVIARF